MSQQISTSRSPRLHDRLHTPKAAGLPEGVHSDQQLLERAGDLIEHLRAQLMELDRRERNVNALSAAFDQERRQLRLAQQQLEAECQQRAEDLADLERQQQARGAELDQFAAALAAQQTMLDQAREELAAQRRQLADDARAELDVQWDQLRQQQSLLEAGFAELTQRRAELQQSLDLEIQEEHAARRASLEQQLAHLQADIVEQRQWWDDSREAARLEFEARRQDEESRLVAMVEQAEQVRQGKLTEIEQRERELRRLQIDIEKRRAFHESHLDQLRRALERRQQELERDEQRVRSSQLQREEQLRLCAAQLVQFRDLLEQREQSLEHEQALFAESRHAWQAEQTRTTLRVEQEQAAHRQVLESERLELQERQQLLALQAQNLEGRRERLDRLRSDLERTHAGTLSLHLAIEQSWAVLAGHAGEEATRTRIEQAHAEIEAHYAAARDALEATRGELSDVRRQLDQQRRELREERTELAEWLSARQAQIEAREQTLRDELETALSRHQQWQATQEQWRREKMAAESLIRDLLGSLDRDVISRLMTRDVPPPEEDAPADDVPAGDTPLEGAA